MESTDGEITSSSAVVSTLDEGTTSSAAAVIGSPLPENGAAVTPLKLPPSEDVDARNAASEKQEDAVANASLSPKTPIDTKPSDIRELTIKNLDTGEEFIIGENDPDFDFNTFELRGGSEEEENGADGTAGQAAATSTSPKAAGTQTLSDAAVAGVAAAVPAATTTTSSWWEGVWNYLYGTSSKKAAASSSSSKNANNGATGGGGGGTTPYTKLSSFKFRRELGRGAFGRVLLAEAKSDGRLYALKIISKANMRSSDKRQAKAERDILHAMGHTAPHPFTTGLKFAFQSENNLYLGMNYLPGGNLRELIKRNAG